MLLPPHQTRRYVLRDKTDGADAGALLEAHRNEQIVPVPVKTLHQHTLAAIHRTRSAWMATRTARLNAIRGTLRELGITIPQGPRHVLPRLGAALADPLQPLPQALHPTLLCLAEEIRDLNSKIHDSERQLELLSNDLPLVQHHLTVPGIGLITATALSAFVGDFSRFPTGRRFAGFLGVVPREHSSGLHRHLGAITKRGDAYLRTLLIHGARSALLAASRCSSPDRLQRWALSLASRRGHNRAATGLANKLARIAWATAVRNCDYHPQTPA